LLYRWFCFTVGFTLPLVLTNGQEAKQLGALAPLTCQENTRKNNKKQAQITRKKKVKSLDNQ